MSLLFSDPTGSGIDDPCAVLVQGTAQVDDANLEANRERYWRESVEKLPATKEMHPPGFMRGFFDWYFTRIYVYVRPERVFVWSGGDFSGEPTLYDSHLEEVRSQPLGGAARWTARRPTGGSPAWDDRMDELGRRHDTAVLSVVGPDGFPMSTPPARSSRTAPDGRVRLGDDAGVDAGGPGASVPDRARARSRVQVAGELPGARRPRARQRRLGARPAQVRRRLRAPEVEAPGLQARTSAR